MSGSEAPVLNPMEFMKKTAEASRVKENNKKTQDITKKLVDNSGIFAGQIEEERSQLVCQEIFVNLGTKYQPDEKGSVVGGIESTLKNPSATDIQKTIATENLNILGNTAFRAINFSFRDYPEGLITSALTGQQIDDFLPVEMKGLGKYVVEADSRLNENERKSILDINSNVSSIIDDENVSIKNVLKQIIEETNEKPDDSLEKQYGQLAVSVVLENKNIEIGKNQSREAVGDIDKLTSCDYEPPVFNKEKDEWEGGSRWELAPEYAAMAMKYMDHSMRWQTYTPPEWYKKLDEETQYKIEVMIAINETAAGLLYAGKDLDKILGNRSAFSFTHEKMNVLYDNEFNLAESKMLNDLCEFYPDQNGIDCLRYKEKFYAFNYKTIKFIDKNGVDIEYGDEITRKHEINEDETNIGKGVRMIDQDVMYKLQNVMDYKESIAVFLASREGAKYTWETYKKDDSKGHKAGDIVKDEKGNPVPHWMNKMNAYTIWNKVFGMGDTSVWDRMRILPTWDGVMSDAVRTLNPEYKAKAKWQIMKSGRIRQDQSLLEFEYFGGNISDYVSNVMIMERDLAKRDKNGDIVKLSPITGTETLREKILNGKMRLLSAKTFYGLNDFVNEGRDLKNNSGRSLARVVMDYASFDKDGNYEIKGDKVEFRRGQTAFMNEFRDSLEAAITAHQYMTGKADAKDLKVWARNIKDKMGMLNGIIWNGKRPFSYTRNPAFWRDVLIGTYGADMNRLSTDHISINNPEDKSGNKKSYSFYIYDLLKSTLQITNTNVNIQETMRLLGVSINDGEAGDSGWVKKKTNTLETAEHIYTNSLKNLQNKKIKQKKAFDRKKVEPYIQKVKEADRYPGNSDFDDLIIAFETALTIGEIGYISSLAEAIEKFKPYKPDSVA